MPGYTSYDHLPYNTQPQRDSNPSRLAAIARALGIEAPSVGACAVLEIGCGTGGNLFPLAERFPESRFVGMDISGRQIREAQNRAQELGLKNSKFLCADISDFSFSSGEFDYIICHGVYSWVPDSTQKRILEVISQGLSANGVAYISYNVLPGWRQRSVIRDVMSFGASLSGSEQLETRVQAGLEFLDVVAASRTNPNDSYGAYVREASTRLQTKDSSYIAHEYLEECNNPCLFTEFMRDAHRVGLQFLLEAKPVFMSTADLCRRAEEFIDRIGGDLILREQALDILRNRAFRETLLCHAERKIKRDLKASAFKELTFVAEYIPCEEKVLVGSADSAGGRYRELSSGKEICLPPGIPAQVLSVVASRYAAGIGIEQLSMEIARSVDVDQRELLAIVASLWSAGFLGLEQLPIPAVAVAAGVAHISKLARLQVGRQEAIASLRHQSFEPTTAERELLLRCDGKYTFAELGLGLQDSKAAEAIVRGLVVKGVFIE